MSVPTCSHCGRISVFPKCRNCATESELAKYPEVPEGRRELKAVTADELVKGRDE